MNEGFLIDTGPLVALINRREKHHGWVLDVFQYAKPPLITCEAVISEAVYLLRHSDPGASRLIALLSRGVVEVRFEMGAHLESIAWLMRRYASVPMSLADACLVCLSETYPTAKLITLDSDFTIYRRRTRHVIPTIMP